MSQLGKNGKNNRGFTLIEMIVTVAIIAIFSGVVLKFMTTGSNIFRSTSNSAQVQMETQATFDKIEDMIINTNRGFYYGYGDNSAINYDDIDSAIPSTGSKVFAVYSTKEDTNSAQTMALAEESDEPVAMSENNNAFSAQSDNTDDDSQNGNGSDFSAGEPAIQSSPGDTMSLIRWDKDAEVITYHDYKYEGGKWQEIPASDNNNLLASGVTDFRADLTKARSANIVRFLLTSKTGTKEVQTQHSVSLRNQISIFDSINVPPSPTKTPTPTLIPTPTATVAPTPTATVTPTPTATVAPTPTATVAPTPTVAVTPTAEPTPTPVPDAVIKGKNGAYAVVRDGSNYSVGINSQIFNFFYKGKYPSDYSSLWKIVWSIEGTDTTNIVLNTWDLGKQGTLNIGSNAKPFILVAKYIVYNGWKEDINDIKLESEAKLPISIASKIEIADLPFILKAGQEYDLKVRIKMEKIRQNMDGQYEYYDDYVDAQNGDSDTALYWNGICNTQQIMKKNDDASKIVIQNPLPDWSKEGDVIVFADKIKGILDYSIKGTALEEDFTAKQQVKFEN